MGDQSIAANVSLAGRALSARIERGLRPYGIGRGEYRVLFALYVEEGVSQTALVNRHHLDKGVIARVVRRLEEKGYVERRSDPADGRRNLLYLTDEAEAIRPDIEALQATINEEITRGLTAEETERFAEALAIASRNLGVDLGERPESVRPNPAEPTE